MLQVRPPADTLLKRLGETGWAIEVDQYAPGRIRILVDDAAAAERDVPGILDAVGAALVSFSPSTDLEHAFLELTS